MNRSRSAFPPDGYSSLPTCSQDVLSDSLVVDTLPPPAPPANINAGTRCCPNCGSPDDRTVSTRNRSTLRSYGLRVSEAYGHCFGCGSRLSAEESHKRYCTSCGPKFDTLPPPPSVPLLHGTRR